MALNSWESPAGEAAMLAETASQFMAEGNPVACRDQHASIEAEVEGGCNDVRHSNCQVGFKSSRLRSYHIEQPAGVIG